VDDDKSQNYAKCGSTKAEKNTANDWHPYKKNNIHVDSISKVSIQKMQILN
jgi:hypothetical protein